MGKMSVAMGHNAEMASLGSRNPGIDLLRGLSILLVVLHHIGLRIPLKRGVLAAYVPEWVLGAINYNGYESVFVFFVISGFLITGNALHRWGGLDRVDGRAFYARRFARIAPCLFALLLVLSALHFLGVHDYVIRREGQTLPGALLAALGLHLNWYEGHFGYLPGNWDVLWSLSIEELFYLGFPIACLLTRRTWVLVLALIVLALSLPWTHAALAYNEVWQEKAYLPGMAAIAAGILGALIAQRWQPEKPWTVRVWIEVGSLGLAAIYFIEQWLWPMLHDACLLLLTVSVMCLLIGLQWRQATGAWRPLALLELAALVWTIELRNLFEPHVCGVCSTSRISDVWRGHEMGACCGTCRQCRCVGYLASGWPAGFPCLANAGYARGC